MGQLVFIKLKTEEDSEIQKVNAILKDMGIETDFTMEKHNIDWLNDINTNVKSHQRHLKPDDRDLELQELKDMFNHWTEVGLFQVDVAFGRTSEEQMQLIAKFIEENIDKIKYVQSGDELGNRAEITEKQKVIIKGLEKKKQSPKKLPIEQRTNTDLQSGVLLCKGWGAGDNKFWVAFGNVDEPKFMKNRIYVDDLYNDLYKTKDGRAVMLIPLMPLSGSVEGDSKFLLDVYNRACEIGLVENPCYFLPMVYKTAFNEWGDIVEQFVKDYTFEELQERFKATFKTINMVYKFDGFSVASFRFWDKEIKFKKTSEKVCGQVDVLTWLLRAMVLKGRAENGKMKNGFKTILQNFLKEVTGDMFFFDHEKVYKIYDKKKSPSLV